MKSNTIYNQLYCKNPVYLWELHLTTPISELIKNIDFFFTERGIDWFIKDRGHSEVFLSNSIKPILNFTKQEFLSLAEQKNFQDFFIYSNSFFMGENLINDDFYKNEILRFSYEKETNILELNIHLDVFANKIENITEPAILDISDIAPINRDILKFFLSYLLEKSQGEVILFGGHYEGFQSKFGIEEGAVSLWY